MKKLYIEGGEDFILYSADCMFKLPMYIPAPSTPIEPHKASGYNMVEGVYLIWIRNNCRN